MALKAIALLGVLAHFAGASSPATDSHNASYGLPVANYGFANTTECKEVTYYELSHGRYLAAPMKHVIGYGDIIGAKRGYHPECFNSMNITNVLLGDATAESNTTTEAMDIKDVLKYARMDNGNNTLDKRLSWLLGPVTLFMKAIGFAGTIMSSLCQIFAQFPDFEESAWSKNNCIVGGVFLAAAAVFGGAVAISGNAAIAFTSSVQTWNQLSMSASAGGEAALEWLFRSVGKRSETDLPGLFRNIAEAHRNTGIAKNITLGGIALTQGINLHHPSGYEYNVMDLMGADHLNPLTRNVTVMNHTIEAHWWIMPHPVKSNHGVLMHRVPGSNLQNVTDIVKRQDALAYDGLGYIEQEGQDTSIEAGGDNPDLYFGMDFYDGPEIIDNTVGPADNGDGEATQMDADAATYIIQNQSWENCVCFQKDGNWAGTGNMQYSWDQTYNGYSMCYAADCDGA